MSVKLLDILVGQCQARGKQSVCCLHFVHVKFQGSDTKEWVPYLNEKGTALLDGVAIYALYMRLSKDLFELNGANSPHLRPGCGLEERHLSDQSHFLEYAGRIPGQKRRNKYNKPPKVSIKPSKRPATTPAAAPKERRPIKKRRLTGDAGGGRMLNSINKHRSRTRAYEKGVERGLTPENVVCKAVTHAGINPNIIKLSMAGSHDDQKFPNTTVHLREVSMLGPTGARASVSLAESGELSTAGAASVEDALLATTLFCSRISTLTGLPFKLENFAPVNYATSMRAKGTIDLPKFQKTHHKFYILYNPDDFKGLIWKLPSDEVVAVLFSEGAVNIVGLKNQKHVNYARDKLCSFIKTHIEPCVEDNKDQKTPTGEMAMDEGGEEEGDEEGTATAKRNTADEFTAAELEQLRAIRESE